MLRLGFVTLILLRGVLAFVLWSLGNHDHAMWMGALPKAMPG